MWPRHSNLHVRHSNLHVHQTRAVKHPPNLPSLTSKVRRRRRLITVDLMTSCDCKVAMAIITLRHTYRCLSADRITHPYVLGTSSCRILAMALFVQIHKHFLYLRRQSTSLSFSMIVTTSCWQDFCSSVVVSTSTLGTQCFYSYSLKTGKFEEMTPRSLGLLCFSSSELQVMNLLCDPVVMLMSTSLLTLSEVWSNCKNNQIEENVFLTLFKLQLFK